MVRALCSIVCLFWILTSVTQAQGPPLKIHTRAPLFPSPNFEKSNTTSSPNERQFRQRGLCREGWQEAKIINSEMTICIQINTKLQTWNEARDTCRKNSGFLLKLESPLLVGGNDVLDELLSRGITNVWTGIHQKEGRLVWDDLSPEPVRAYYMGERNSSSYRQWYWDPESFEEKSEYCGQLQLTKDTDDRRKKRASEDHIDSESHGIMTDFDMAHLRNLHHLRSSPSQTIPTRHRFSQPSMSRPKEAPSPFGTQKSPGTSLGGQNIQNGGLSTGLARPAINPFQQPSALPTTTAPDTGKDSDSEPDQQSPTITSLLDSLNPGDSPSSSDNLDFLKNMGFTNIQPGNNLGSNGASSQQTSPMDVDKLMEMLKNAEKNLPSSGTAFNPPESPDPPSPTDLTNPDKSSIMDAVKKLLDPTKDASSTAASDDSQDSAKQDSLVPFNNQKSNVPSSNFHKSIFPAALPSAPKRILPSVQSNNQPNTQSFGDIADLLKDALGDSKSSDSLDSMKEQLGKLKESDSAPTLFDVSDKLKDSKADDKLKDAVKESPNPLGETLSDVTDKVKDAISEAADMLKDSVNDSPDPLGETMPEFTDKVKDAISEGSSPLSEILPDASIDLKDPKVGDSNPVDEKLSEAAEKLKDAITSGPRALLADTADKRKDGMSKGSNPKDEMPSGASEKDKNDGDVLFDVSDKLKDSLSEGPTSSDDSAKSNLNKVFDAMKGNIEGVGRVPPSVDNTTDLIDDVKDTANNIKIKTPEEMKTESDDIIAKSASDDSTASAEAKIPDNTNKKNKTNVSEDEDETSARIDGPKSVKSARIDGPNTSTTSIPPVNLADDKDDKDDVATAAKPSKDDIGEIQTEKESKKLTEVISDDTDTLMMEKEVKTDDNTKLLNVTQHDLVDKSENDDKKASDETVLSEDDKETPMLDVQDQGKDDTVDSRKDEKENNPGAEHEISSDANNVNKTKAEKPDENKASVTKEENLNDDAVKQEDDAVGKVLDKDQETDMKPEEEIKNKDMKMPANVTTIEKRDDETEEEEHEASLLEDQKDSIEDLKEKAVEDLNDDVKDSDNNLDQNINNVTETNDFSETEHDEKEHQNIEEAPEDATKANVSRDDSPEFLDDVNEAEDMNEKEKEEAKDIDANEDELENEKLLEIVEDLKKETDDFNVKPTTAEGEDDKEIIEIEKEQEKEDGLHDEAMQGETFHKEEDQDADTLGKAGDSDMDIDDGTLREAIQPGERRTRIDKLDKMKMKLSECDIILPSVCFTYQIEVLPQASTCDDGWYGHYFFDRCYKILDDKNTYARSLRSCQAYGARVAAAATEFQRKFILMAVFRHGKYVRGTKFWQESQNPRRSCNYFDERGVKPRNCNQELNVVCEKPAQRQKIYKKPDLSLEVTEDEPDVPKRLTLASANPYNSLQCPLASTTSELPTLWYRDGQLVDTIYTTPVAAKDNAVFRESTALTLKSPQIANTQGKFWCEAWTSMPLMRRRSQPYLVRYEDVMSFRGSLPIREHDDDEKEQLFFNAMGTTTPELGQLETKVKNFFKNLLPTLQVTYPTISNISTHVDHIGNDPATMQFSINLQLKKPYTGKEEAVVYHRITTILKSAMGNPNYMGSVPSTTDPELKHMTLQSTVSCPASELTSDEEDHLEVAANLLTLSFPRTSMGQRAFSVETCNELNLNPAGFSICLGDFFSGAHWDEVKYNEDCSEGNDVWGVSAYTDKLSELAEQSKNESMIEEVVEQMEEIAEVAEELTPTDVSKIAEVIEHSTETKEISQKVSKGIINTMNRLIEDVTEEKIEVANDETQAANRIIKAMERCADKVALEDDDRMRLVTDNVAMEVWKLDPRKPVIGLAARSLQNHKSIPFVNERITTIYNESQLHNAKVDAAIELPREVFEQQIKGEHLGDRLTMMVYRKNNLFDAAARNGQRRRGESFSSKMSILDSYIISASIAGRKLTGLKNKVKTIFRPLKDIDDERRCVFWDFDMNDYRGGWSTDGCQYDGKVNGRDVCLCDHLTNFAVLLDFYGQGEPIPQHHELSLSIITVIGLSLSILGLSLTIISYAFFRKLRQGRAQQTLFNLALALLCSMLIFLTGIKQTQSYYGCIVVAALLHYFILASFMWMLMEAVLQYLTFVKVLGTYITRFTLKTVVPAWGIPAIPVICISAIDYTLYKGGPDYCWMSLPAFYYGFAIPITAIILVNIVIFFITVISITRRGQGLRTNQTKQKMAMTNLQAAITSFILLGLTWTFGYLAISDARLPFQYIFTILNSLQGFFIFVLFVARKKKVRDQWYIICCHRGGQEKVSRSLSATNSIPSSYNSNSSGRERDRSDSTKTTTSIASSFTNHGYEAIYDMPYTRRITYRT